MNAAHKPHPLEHLRDDPRGTEDLIRIALTKDADEDDDDYWTPVWALQYRLPAILPRIKELAAGDERSRQVAAAVLGQNGVRDKAAANDCFEFLMSMLSRESAPYVLESIVFSIGQFNDSRSIGALIALKNHADARIRHAVVHSLNGFEDDGAVHALIELSADSDFDVRNWATFGLGTLINLDTPEIREALRQRLVEEDDELRGEAFVGLAKRGDTACIAAILRELDSLEASVLRDWVLIRNAAEFVVDHAHSNGNKAWLPVLERLRELQIGDVSRIGAAIESCKKPGSLKSDVP